MCNLCCLLLINTVGGALNIRIESCRVLYIILDVRAFRGTTSIHVEIVRCRFDFGPIFQENVLANCYSKYIITVKLNPLGSNLKVLMF